MRTHSFRLIAIATCLLAGTIALFAPASTGAATQSSCVTNSAEYAFGKRVNRMRVNKGRTRLTIDYNTNAVSRKHAREMAALDSLVHTPISRLKRRVTNWSSLGENIAVIRNGSSLTPAEKASRAFTMFMNSTPHRENLQRRGYRHQGIGFITVGNDVWITHTFTGRKNPGTRLTGTSFC